MKHSLLQGKYPIVTLDVAKDQTRFDTVDAIIDYLKACIDAHEVARYLGEFDHLAHTQALPTGEIASDIKAAKHVMFCFGSKLPNAEVLAVRPRSIGVADQGDRFVITFMEAPMPPANEAMQRWVGAIPETLDAAAARTRARALIARS
jgi:hypothetical protein